MTRSTILSTRVLVLDSDRASEYLTRLAAAEASTRASLTTVDPRSDQMLLGASGEPPDVILFHLTTWGVSISKLAEMLAQHPTLAGVPVVVFCAWQDRKVELDARERGFRFVALAFDLDLFCRQISELLASFAVPTYLIRKLYGYGECVIPVRHIPPVMDRRRSVPAFAAHNCARRRASPMFPAAVSRVRRGRRSGSRSMRHGNL